MAYYKKSYPKTSTNANGSPKKKWNPNWGKEKVAPGSQYKPPRALDEAQQAIVAHMDKPESLLVSAYAGTGKTTVCVESMYHIKRTKPSASVGYLIYASRNKDEAIGKCPAQYSPDIKTVHAYGLKCIATAFGKIDVSKDKHDNIATALVGPEDEKAELRYMLGRGMDLAKDYLATTQEEVIRVCDKHGIEFCTESSSSFAEKVLEGLEVSARQTNIVSFSDMTWLPLKLNLNIPQLDIVFADECQDLNLARIELVMRIVGPNSKFVGVGDENQSIFGFSGADKEAIAKLRQRANAETLPLHRTYRCCKAVVEMAKSFVPDYEAASQNEEGEVCTNVPESRMIEEAGPGDFILSRTNAPLIAYAMEFLKQGRKCNIQGRDLGKSLLFMFKRSDATDVDGFLGWLNTWEASECERLVKRSPNASVEHITDRAECLRAFCEGTRDLEVAKGRIKQMFDDKEDDHHRIILSTVHRAKGLERDRVWLLESSFVCRPKTDEDIQQEKNIRYVAITRAKNSLMLVD